MGLSRHCQSCMKAEWLFDALVRYHDVPAA